MRRLLLSIFVFMMFAPLTALAAAPLVTVPMEVQLWPSGQPEQSVVIVSIDIPKDIELPVTVQLPLPDGAKLDWVGEITGTDASQDPTRTYEVKNGVGGRYVEFEVSKSRQAQLEASGLPLAVDGDTYTGTVRWVQSTPASVTGFAILLPAGVEPVTMSPKPEGKAQTNVSGETLYGLPDKSLKTGDSLKVRVTYQASGALPDVATGPDYSKIALYTLLGVLAVVVVVVSAIAQRNASDTASEDDLDVDSE